jgi:hypothetical protein
MEEPELRFKLVDFCTSGILDLVESLEGLGFGDLKLLEFPNFFEYSRR